MKQFTTIKSLLFILMFSVFSNLSYSQECLETAAIDGVPGAAVIPAGWDLWMSTPDLIAGLGPWPGGGYFVYDVDGISSSGGEMQLILANAGTPGEGIQTTLTGLTIGASYSVSIEWQQMTLSNDDPGFPIIYEGGKLALTVDGVETEFASVGGMDDPWQVATVTFVAIAPTALLQCGIKASDVPTAEYGYGIVIDDYSCSMEFEVNLTDQSICIDDCVDLIATTTGAVGAVTYEWSPGIVETDDEVTVCPDVTTEYEVIATDSDGNIATTTAIVTVNPKPVVDLGPDVTISLCPGVTFTLDAGNPGSTYLWQDGSTDQTLDVTSGGNYSVTVTNAEGCEETDNINITVVDPLVLVVESVEPNCFGYTDGSVTVFASGGLGDLIYVITDADGNVINVANSNTVAGLGTGTYYFTVTDEAGCSETTSIFLDQPESLIAEFTFSPSAPRINEEVAFTDLTEGATEWSWDFGDGGTSNDANPRHTFTTPSTFEITLNVTAGICTEVATAIITIENTPIFYVPNAFTPDGDDFNETFQPVFTSGFDPYDFHMLIFNRWGEVVFESYNAAYGWDGNFGNSGNVIDGVYIWQIEFGDSKTDEKHKHAGHVTILK
jgi:gliding motility-associated-like protein